MAPFFDFLKSTIPWFIFFKYVLGLAPISIDFIVPLVMNYLNKVSWIFEGTPYIPLIWIGIMNYALTLPVDLFLVAASTSLSEKNVIDSNGLYRATCIVFFIWQAVCGLAGSFGVYYNFTREYLADLMNGKSRMSIGKSPMFDLMSSSIATIMSLGATSAFGLYVESRLALE